MSFGFYLPNKNNKTAEWVPEYGQDFSSSATADFKNQLASLSAGGDLYVQEKGFPVREFNLNFTQMKESDRDNLWIFFKDKALKAMNPFEFEDGDGDRHLVTWSNEFNFRKTSPGLFSGNIILREELA